MAKEKKLFLGGMDKDSDLRLIKNGDYRSAVNARVLTAESEGDMGAVTNMKGSERIEQLVVTAYPGKDHTCIGSVEDPSFDRIIYFVSYTGLGEPVNQELDSIWEYHLGTNTAFPILTSNELNFSPKHRVNDANIVAHSESYSPEGLLFFTDGNNPPRKINIAEEKLLSGLSHVENSTAGNKKYVCDFTEYTFDKVDPIMEYYNPGGSTINDRINAAVVAPLEKPLIQFDSDTTTLNQNYIKGKAFKFKYRYIYRDKQKSAWSPISELAASEAYTPNDVQIPVSQDNVVKVGVRVENKYIEGIELAARDITNTDQYTLVDTLSYNYHDGWHADSLLTSAVLTSFPTVTAYDADNNPSPSYYDGDRVWFFFYNEETYSVVDERESNKLFNNIPIKAITQDIVDGNRLVYGNVTTGRDGYTPGLNLERYVSKKKTATTNSMYGSVTASCTADTVKRKCSGICSCYKAIDYVNYTVKLTFPTLPGAADNIGLSAFQLKNLPWSYYGLQAGNSSGCPCNDIHDFAFGTLSLVPFSASLPGTPGDPTAAELQDEWHDSFIQNFSGTVATTAGASITEDNTNGMFKVVNKSGVQVRGGHVSNTSADCDGCTHQWDATSSSNWSQKLVTQSGNSIYIRFAVLSNSFIKTRDHITCGRGCVAHIGKANKVTSTESIFSELNYNYYSFPVLSSFPSDFSEDDINGGDPFFGSSNGTNCPSNSSWSKYLLAQGTTDNAAGYATLLPPVKSLAVSYTSLSDEYDPVESTFKTGAFHTFGIVYYDKQGRSSSVQDKERIYIPTHMENVAEIEAGEGYFDTGSEFEGAAGQCVNEALWGIEWYIDKSKAPSWADSYQLVYTGNQNIGKFEQFTCDGFKFPEDSRLEDYAFVDITPLKKTIEATGGKGVDIEYAAGDRLRIINTYDATNNKRISGTLASHDNTKFDFNVVDIVTVTRYVPDNGLSDDIVTAAVTTPANYKHVHAKGEIIDVIFEADEDAVDGDVTGIGIPVRGYTDMYAVINKKDLNSFNHTDNNDDVWNSDGVGSIDGGDDEILTDTLVELYRPKATSGDEDLVFYEFSEKMDIQDTLYTFPCVFELGSNEVTFFAGSSGGIDYTDGAPVSLGIDNIIYIGAEVFNPNTMTEPASITSVTLSADGNYITSFNINFESEASYSDQVDGGVAQTSVTNYSHTTGVGSTQAVQLIKSTNGDVNGDVYIRKRTYPMAGTNISKWSESYHYTDFFKSDTWSNGRPNKELPYYQQTNKASTIIYTGSLISNTYLNSLNSSFEDTDFEEYDKSNGSIQKLHSKDNYIVIFQEDKVLKALVNRNITYNADGSQQLGLSNQVLSKSVPYPWEGGIGFHPESFASYGDDMYFYDSQRGEVIKLSERGVEVVSDHGMSSFFRTKSKELVLQDRDIKIRGAYDVSTSEYVLAFDGIYTKEPIDICELFADESGGDWEIDVVYAAGDVVAYTDESTLVTSYWISQLNDNVGVTPGGGGPSAMFWGVCNATSLNLLGCTDALAANYNETALINDGSCTYSCFNETLDEEVAIGITTSPSTVDNLIVLDPYDMATGSFTYSVTTTTSYVDGFAAFVIYDGDIISGEFGATGGTFSGLESGYYQFAIIDMASLLNEDNFSDSWSGLFEDAGDGLSGDVYDNFLADMEIAFEQLYECGMLFDVEIELLACDEPAALNYVGGDLDASMSELLLNPSDYTEGAPNPCYYFIDGCVNENADNYDTIATADDGSCVDCVTPEGVNQLFSATITNVAANVSSATVDIEVTMTSEAQNDPDWSPSYEINIYQYDLTTAAQVLVLSNTYPGSYTTIGTGGVITYSGLAGLNTAAIADINDSGAAVQSYYVEVIATGMCSDAYKVLTPVMTGCSDSTAINYNPLVLSANDNGTCIDCTILSDLGYNFTVNAPTSSLSVFTETPTTVDLTVVWDDANGVAEFVSPVGVTQSVELFANGVSLPQGGSFVNPIAYTTSATSASFVDVPYGGVETTYHAVLTTTYALGSDGSFSNTDATPIECQTVGQEYVTPIAGCVVSGAPNYNSIADYDCSGTLQSASYSTADLSAIGAAVGAGTLDIGCCGLCEDFDISDLLEWTYSEGTSLYTNLTITDTDVLGGVDQATGNIEFEDDNAFGGSGEYSYTIIDSTTGEAVINGSLLEGVYTVLVTDVNYLCSEQTVETVTVGANIAGCMSNTAKNYNADATITSSNLPYACQYCPPSCALTEESVFAFWGDIVGGMFEIKNTDETLAGSDGTITFTIVTELEPDYALNYAGFWNDAHSQLNDFSTFIKNQNGAAYIRISLYDNAEMGGLNLVGQGFYGSNTPATFGAGTTETTGGVKFSGLSDIDYHWKIEYLVIPSIDDGSGISADEFIYSSDNTTVDWEEPFDIFNNGSNNGCGDPTPIQYKNLQGCEYTGYQPINAAECPTNASWATGGDFSYGASYISYFNPGINTSGISLTYGCDNDAGLEWNINVPNTPNIASVVQKFILVATVADGLVQETLIENVYSSGDSDVVTFNQADYASSSGINDAYEIVTEVTYTSGITCNYSLQGILIGCEGCSDPDAYNYNANASAWLPSALCTYQLSGCYEEGYDNTPTLPDGITWEQSQDFDGVTAISTSIPPYNSYIIDNINGDCYLEGCTYSGSPEYNSSATLDDGSCSHCKSAGAFNQYSGPNNIFVISDPNACRYCASGYSSFSNSQTCIVNSDGLTSADNGEQISVLRFEFNVGLQSVDEGYLPAFGGSAAGSYQAGTVAKVKVYHNSVSIGEAFHEGNGDDADFSTSSILYGLDGYELKWSTSNYLNDDSNGDKMVEIRSANSVLPAGDYYIKYSAQDQTAEANVTNIDGVALGDNHPCLFYSDIVTVTEQCPTNLKMISEYQLNQGVNGLALIDFAMVPKIDGVDACESISIHGEVTGGGGIYTRFAFSPENFDCWLDWDDPTNRFMVFDIDGGVTQSEVYYNSQDELYYIDVAMEARAGEGNIVLQLSEQEYVPSASGEQSFQNNDAPHCRYLINMAYGENVSCSINQIDSLVSPSDSYLEINIVNSEAVLDNSDYSYFANAVPEIGGWDNFILPPTAEIGGTPNPTDYLLSLGVCDNNVEMVDGWEGSFLQTPEAEEFFNINTLVDTTIENFYNIEGNDVSGKGIGLNDSIGWSGAIQELEQEP